MIDPHRPEDGGLDDALRAWGANRAGAPVTDADVRALMVRAQTNRTRRQRRFALAGAVAVLVVGGIWLRPGQRSTAPSPPSVAERPGPVASTTAPDSVVVVPMPPPGRRQIVGGPLQWPAMTKVRIAEAEFEAVNVELALAATSTGSVIVTVRAGRLRWLAGRRTFGPGQHVRVEGGRVSTATAAADLAPKPPRRRPPPPRPRSQPRRPTKAPAPARVRPPPPPAAKLPAAEPPPRSRPAAPAAPPPPLSAEIASIRAAWAAGNQDAESRLQALLSRQSNAAEPWLLLAQIRARQGRHGEAAEAYGRAATLVPARRRLSILFERGSALHRAGRPRAAARQWESVRTDLAFDHPLWPSVRLRLAEVWVQLENPDAARRVLREILVRKPGSPSAAQAEAMLNRLPPQGP